MLGDMTAGECSFALSAALSPGLDTKPAEYDSSDGNVHKCEGVHRHNP